MRAQYIQMKNFDVAGPAFLLFKASVPSPPLIMTWARGTNGLRCDWQTMLFDETKERKDSGAAFLHEHYDWVGHRILPACSFETG